MPIETSCPNCGTHMRIPDDQAITLTELCERWGLPYETGKQWIYKHSERLPKFFWIGSVRSKRYRFKMSDVLAKERENAMR